MHCKISQGNKKLSGANIKINLKIVSGNIPAVSQKRKMNSEFRVRLTLQFTLLDWSWQSLLVISGGPQLCLELPGER